jgi:ankyrin repeat protein
MSTVHEKMDRDLRPSISNIMPVQCTAADAGLVSLDGPMSGDELLAALCLAAESGDVVSVSSLVRSGVDINGKIHGSTPLKLAASRSHVSVARVLLRYGAKLGDGDEVSFRIIVLHLHKFNRDLSRFYSSCHKRHVFALTRAPA